MRKTKKEQNESEEVVIKNLTSSDSLQYFILWAESINYSKHFGYVGKLILFDVFLIIVLISMIVQLLDGLS